MSAQTAYTISIHAPRGGSDAKSDHAGWVVANFNPRSPWGERPQANQCCHTSKRISIHAPRGGSDLYNVVIVYFVPHFNPRSPWGERPAAEEPEEAPEHFNPRSPWGERQVQQWHGHKADRFQSTLPVGGATSGKYLYKRLMPISIHAPRGGSDRYEAEVCGPSCHFNPRSPWGERQSETGTESSL